MKRLIIANWKMNPSSFKEAEFLFGTVKKVIEKIEAVETVICPPFVYLLELKIKNKEAGIKLGGQNCFWENFGAYTGEISPKMLKNIGCQYVIVGHSERRNYFTETDEMINRKLKNALKVGLKPILCIGETEEEKRLGKTEAVLKKQLKNCFLGIRNSKMKIGNLILAYEPVWAIGTGRACSPVTAEEILLFLKKQLKPIPILYGGSVNSQNARDYLRVGFDGLLVGAASLEAKEFIKIIREAAGVNF